MMSSWHIEAKEMVVRFNNSQDILGAAKADSCGGKLDHLPTSALTGLAITDDSFVWRWANATYQEGALRVWAEGVDHPVAARYNWARNPIGNLVALS
jgi:hypothetical protein